MPADWSFAWQVGAVGFGLVFVILIILYLALALIGWLSARYSPVNIKPTGNKPTPVPQEKKAPITG
jgi:Na+-transporting methylmalonyl-CoA/oxaloacetate decarboxylase gamma subunit